MGQKVSPHGLRVGVIQDWDSKWYADKNNFSDFLIEDKKIREYVKKKLYMAGISRILIERAAERSAETDDPHRQAGHDHRKIRRGHR